MEVVVEVEDEEVVILKLIGVLAMEAADTM